MNANIRTIGGSIGAAVMASIMTSQLLPSGLPKESGYTTGFAVMAAGTARATTADTVNPGVTVSDVMALIWAMRGLVQTAGEVAPKTWQRFLDIQLAGMRAAGPLSSQPPMSSRQLLKLDPQRRP